MEALVFMFCIFGVPSEMLADIRTQFTSELMVETSRLLSFRQMTIYTVPPDVQRIGRTL